MAQHSNLARSCLARFLPEVSVNDGGMNEDVPDVSIAELESMSRNDRYEQLRAECYLHADSGTHGTAVL